MCVCVCPCVYTLPGLCAVDSRELRFAGIGLIAFSAAVVLDALEGERKWCRVKSVCVFVHVCEPQIWLDMPRKHTKKGDAVNFPLRITRNMQTPLCYCLELP